MKQKTVYWRNLSNLPIDTKPQKPTKRRRKPQYNQNQIDKNRVLAIAFMFALIMLILVAIWVIEYLRNFQLTWMFVFTTSYLLSFLILAIYGIRFAVFSKLPEFKNQKQGQTLLSYEPTLPKESVNTAHISIPVDKDKVKDPEPVVKDPEPVVKEEDNQEMSEDERKELKKRLKEKGNVFTFPEDWKLTKGERDKMEENKKCGWNRVLYPKDNHDPTITVYEKK